MKYLIGRFLWFVPVLLGWNLMFAHMASAQSLAPADRPSGALLCSQKKSNGNALLSIGATSASPTHAYDVLNYRLNLDIYSCFLSPYPHSYNALEVITFRADSSLDSIALDAVNSSLTVDSVGYDGASFAHAADILTVRLGRSLVPGDVDSVRIYYRHNPVNDYAFYASNGMVFTDCEPQGARKWFPCWDEPSDKATTDITTKVPATVKLGSNGRLADSTTIADTTWFHWVSRDPVATYLVVMTGKIGYNLDIVPWHKLSDSTQIVPMRFYWNAGETTSNLDYIESIIGPMTTRYSQLFGEHPFEKNGFATIPAGAGFPWGGMENQTLTSLCADCWYESLVSHEFAHQWFGDMITCGTWADIWLNEGFATYCEALWDEYWRGAAVYKSDIVGDASGYLNNNPGWPIYNASWAVTPPSEGVLFNTAITYDKGACVLHMLRYVLSDSLFFAAMKGYATDTLNFKYKSAVTADWLAKMSSVAGQDLSWFGEWLYQPNHPTYQNTYAIASPSPGAWTVTFRVRQTQKNAAFFQMPIDIRLSFSSGPDSTVRVFNGTNNQSFTFTLDRQPLSVQFDPDNNIVLKTATLSQTAVDEANLLPGEYRLEQNYPNPFNPSTEIGYRVQGTGYGVVTLKVYDVLGREVAVLVNERKGPGRYTVRWDASTYSSGVYLYTLRASNGHGVQFVSTKAMVLIK